MHGQEGRRAERSGRRWLCQATGMERRTCWDRSLADGRGNAVDHLLLGGGPGKAQRGGLRERTSPAPPTPATPAGATDQMHPRVMAPLGFKSAGPNRWAAAAPARFLPPSTIAAWWTPVGRKNQPNPEQKGLHSPAGGEANSRQMGFGHRTGSESGAGADGEWARLRSRKEAGLTARRQDAPAPQGQR